MADFIDRILGTDKTPTYGPQTQSSWNLVRGVFTQKDNPRNSVVFFTETAQGEDRRQLSAIDQTTDTGGRRLAIYEYPYKNGQKVKDLGARGETHNFTIKFFGDNYQQKLEEFLRIVNSRYAGTLSHPSLSSFRGSITVRLREYEIQHRHDEWNAVSIRVVFVDDNSEDLDSSKPIVTVDAAIRASVQDVVNGKSYISELISSIGRTLALPGTVLSALQGRLTNVTNLKAKLLGQLSSTYNLGSAFNTLFSDASALVGGLLSITSGTSSGAGGVETVGTNLPPVFQVGYDPVTQAIVEANTDQYVSQAQLTPQQAVFEANKVRQSLTAAITEINETLGNAGADIVLEYRKLAVSIQEAVEASIAQSQSRVKLFVVPRNMSLRAIAYENGLSTDRQNEIESLNPYLPSINLIPKGSTLSVPVA